LGFLSGFFVSKDSCHAGVKAQAAFAAAFLLFLVMSRPYAYAHLQIVEGFTALLVVAALVAASLMTEGSSGSRVGRHCLQRDWAHPMPHLRWDWAHPMPHLRRDWAHPMPHLRRHWARPCHLCAGTGMHETVCPCADLRRSSIPSPSPFASFSALLSSCTPTETEVFPQHQCQRSLVSVVQECVSPSTYHGYCSSQYY
jgi:hypothetical protein